MDVCLLGGHVAVEGCGHWSDHTHVHKTETHMYTHTRSKATPSFSCSYCDAVVRL